ncbi:endonuclease/exonuclease/phosphatase family protein [Nocardia australiensis]|uniref:endonuclease/exonuclease/phosphatase family protein n=1 Tax=Nocardia australiensis TaxID=2887191 RepID=UPI001D15DBD5|nr:endonuclease/exonuclease/phosphatase family protein [Nocardia australiensis]
MDAFDGGDYVGGSRVARTAAESDSWVSLGLPARSSAANARLRERQLRVASWNIAGARPVRSKTAFDYGQVDLDYFAKVLRRMDADVVYIQESEVGLFGSTATALAERAGYPHVFETKMCPSHMDTSKTLSIAVLSRLPIEAAHTKLLPVPLTKLKFNGRPTVPFERQAQAVEIAGVTHLTTHPSPYEFLQASYAHGEGVGDALANGRTMRSMVEGRPAILGGDFNTPEPGKVYGDIVDDLGVRMALPPGTKTVPWPGAPDQVGATSEFSVVASGVGRVQSDHFPVWADYQINEPALRQQLIAARQANAAG